MSEEHKILGFRPPHGSFAAEVQSVAAKHPEGKPGAPIDTTKLKEIAREDALRADLVRVWAGEPVRVQRGERERDRRVRLGGAAVGGDHDEARLPLGRAEGRGEGAALLRPRVGALPQPIFISTS